MKENNLRLKVYTVASAVPEEYYHGVIPTTVILDKQGKIIFLREGEEQYNSKKFIDLIEEAARQ
jgi:hypothetical protein